MTAPTDRTSPGGRARVPGAWLSSAERFALAGIALIVLLQLVDAAGPALEYRHDRLLAEPWRVLTAHLVHVNARHVLLNAIVWFVFARLFAPELGARRQAVVLGSGALAIGIGLATGWPGIQWYRGASGVLYAVFFAGAVGWLGGAWTGRPAGRWRRLAIPAVLTVGGWVKIIAEMPAGTALPVNAWLSAPVVPQAHLLGAAAGTLVAAAGWILDARRARARTFRNS